MNKRLGLNLVIVFATCIAIAQVHAVRDDGDKPVPPPIDPPKLDTLKLMIDRAMPEDVQEDNSKLLKLLLEPEASPTGPSDKFDIRTAPRKLGMRRAVPSKGCFAPPPRLSCTMGEGSRDGGGAYKQIQADSVGNISFVSRLPDPSLGNPEKVGDLVLPSFTMDDLFVIDSFFNIFVKVFGVPPMEAPDPSSWKVDRMLVGMQDAERSTLRPEIKEVAGMVEIPRMLTVRGLSLPAVRVLGSQVQGAIDDQSGGLPFRVEVQGWTRFTIPSALQRAEAMPRSDLVGHIAGNLINDLREMPDHITVEIAYAKVGQFDELGSYSGGDADDDSGPAADGIPDAHRYVPVLLTSVSPMSADADEEEQAGAFSTAGVEFVTPLFKLSE